MGVGNSVTISLLWLLRIFKRDVQRQTAGFPVTHSRDMISILVVDTSVQSKYAAVKVCSDLMDTGFSFMKESNARREDSVDEKSRQGRTCLL
jgi:hypothetical protein